MLHLHKIIGLCCTAHFRQAIYGDTYTTTHTHTASCCCLQGQPTSTGTGYSQGTATGSGTGYNQGSGTGYSQGAGTPGSNQGTHVGQTQGAGAGGTPGYGQGADYSGAGQTRTHTGAPDPQVTAPAAVTLMNVHVTRAWPVASGQWGADILWPIWEQQLEFILVHEAL